MARAQVDLRRPDPIAVELTEARLSFQTHRREAGAALLSFGLASAVAGGVTMGVAHEDPFWLGFGVGTAVWGAINAALSFAMLDLGDAGFAAIEGDRELRGEALARARERVLRDQSGSQTLFALNTGLDVLYVLSGVLLFFVADQLADAGEQSSLRGYAISQVTQGAFLLVFDVVEWIAAIAAADRVAAIEMPRW